MTNALILNVDRDVGLMLTVKTWKRHYQEWTWGLVKEDLTYAQMRQNITTSVRRRHKDEDWVFWLPCCLTGIRWCGFAKTEKYLVDELWGYFTAKKSPTLASKPKIFLIQAWQGKKDRAQKIENPKMWKWCNAKQWWFWSLRSNLWLCDLFSTMPDFVSY